MKIIYIADDGKQFDNEWDCEDYEWKLNHPNLKDVHVFNEEGVEFENIFWRIHIITQQKSLSRAMKL